MSWGKDCRRFVGRGWGAVSWLPKHGETCVVNFSDSLKLSMRERVPPKFTEPGWERI